jgi:hypothetical protein
MLDIPIGNRVKWLADEQAAGRGTVVLCGVCRGSGCDPEDPMDICTPCRAVGAVLLEIRTIPHRRARPSPLRLLARIRESRIG